MVIKGQKSLTWARTWRGASVLIGDLVRRRRLLRVVRQTPAALFPVRGSGVRARPGVAHRLRVLSVQFRQKNLSSSTENKTSRFVVLTLVVVSKKMLLFWFVMGAIEINWKTEHEIDWAKRKLSFLRCLGLIRLQRPCRWQRCAWKEPIAFWFAREN